MRHEFRSTAPATISAGAPSVVTSPIDVVGLDGGVLEDVDVTVDIEHSWDGDLTLSLVAPSGQRIVLVDRRGGRGDHFRGTVFDVDAPISIRNASPPFTGTFRPEGSLAELRGLQAGGRWQLEVRDRAFHDGGRLNEWRLVVVTRDEAPQASPFNIDVRFRGGLTEAQKQAFAVAAQRWSELIVADLPAVRIDGETVDDLLIEAEGVPIDGPGTILGQAGPRIVRPNTFLPVTGIMSFDSADLAQMEAEGSLVRVIVHEMGHVLGLGGRIWDRLGLRQGVGTVNPVFTGANAMREFAALRDGAPQEAVPLANRGGPGTRDSHWREEVFGNELMTGCLDAGVNPLSRLTVGALDDMGYEVNYDAADAYALPDSLMLAIMGVGAEEQDHGNHGIVLVPDVVVAPESALA